MVDLIQKTDDPILQIDYLSAEMPPRAPLPPSQSLDDAGLQGLPS